MKFKYEKTVVVEEYVDIDDRIYEVGSTGYKIANIILDERMKRIYDDLYDKDARVVRNAAEQINDAFKKADAILKLVYTTGSS